MKSPAFGFYHFNCPHNGLVKGRKHNNKLTKHMGVSAKPPLPYTSEHDCDPTHPNRLLYPYSSPTLPGL